MDAVPRNLHCRVEPSTRQADQEEADEHRATARLVALTRSPRREVAQRAVLVLGHLGHPRFAPVLAEALHYPDPLVAAAAEHALWCIWFREGGRRAEDQLCEQIVRMSTGQLWAAIRGLSDLIRRAPEFAEAYNQRATAYYLAGEAHQAALDYRRALRLNRFHFAACAGEGHCFAQLGLYREALRAYLAARQIHPRLEGVRQSIRRIRELMSSSNHAGGTRPASAALAGSMDRRY